MIVEVYNEHQDGSPDLDALERLGEQVVEKEGWLFNISAIIVNDGELRRINRLFLNSDDYTDVIAFPVDDEDEDSGEIYISLDQAREQAIETGESVQKATERLLVHGILHLGGWDDHTDNDREKMIAYGELYLSGA